MKEKNYDMPALKVYITRLGAEQLNFRTYQIIESKGPYYTQKVLIRLDKEGVIHCSRAGYDPTPEEAEAIQKEYNKCDDFPKSILATKSNLRQLKKLVGDDEIYEFYKRNVSPEEGNIIMCQKRMNHEDGSKSYIPWTFYSDGMWRAMEPDGELPFYKPEKRRSARIMIHEGAKAAAFVEKIIEQKIDHPWSKEFEQYEHWGIIGGALAVHRADFKELKTSGAVEVVYVCDNDRLGTESLTVVSRCYGKKLEGIYFDKRWPQSWDCADPMPADFFKEGIYVGPALNDLRVPGTWATEEIKNDDGKKKSYRLSEAFVEDWAHCINPSVYVYINQPHIHHDEDSFNKLVRPFSDVKNTAELIVCTNSAKVMSLLYDPAHAPGIFQKGVRKNAGRYLNTHVPGDIEPKKGDVEPWLEYLNYLFPVELDRTEVMRWCATLIARPDIKMQYGLLLISTTQGVGKTTLGSHILAPLVGPHNVSYPKEKEIVDSNFNSWQSRKRLAVVNEIYAGHSAKAYNVLKDVITDTTIRVNEKFMSEYQIDNWCHIMACSNDERALKLAYEDRRWLVPKLNEDLKPREWWHKFYKWLSDDGLSSIAFWAKEWLKENQPVVPGDRAPETERKEEIKEATMSAGQLFVKDKLKMLREKHKGKHLVLVVNDLVELIKREIYDNRRPDFMEKPLTVRKVAKELGWHISEKRMFVESANLSYLISTHPNVLRASWREITGQALAIRIDSTDGKTESLQSL